LRKDRESHPLKICPKSNYGFLLRNLLRVERVIPK
jgi:hypothetical protein